MVKCPTVLTLLAFIHLSRINYLGQYLGILFEYFQDQVEGNSEASFEKTCAYTSKY